MVNHPHRSKQPTTEHTPTPWNNGQTDYTVADATGNILARCNGGDTGAGQDRANAAMIVRAVNAFDAMLEALERIVTDDKQGACDLRHDARMMADAALRLANGEG